MKPKLSKKEKWNYRLQMVEKERDQDKKDKPNLQDAMDNLERIRSTRPLKPPSRLVLKGNYNYD
jgi:hypothetical protein